MRVEFPVLLGPKVAQCRRAEVVLRSQFPVGQVRRAEHRRPVSRETVRFVAVRTTGN